MFTFENILWGGLLLIWVGVIGLNIAWYFGLFKD